MLQQHNTAELRPFVSGEDLGMIISAIGAYKHMPKYRDLHDRLQRQATVWGVNQPAR